MNENNHQIAVIGMGTFGTETVRSLMRHGIPVCAIDINEELIDELKEQVTSAIILDSTNEKALREIEIEKMDAVVVAIGAAGIENSIMTVALLKQLGARKIIGRSCTALHERILLQVGADAVVNPERDMAERLAKRIAHPELFDMLQLPAHMCIAKVPAPESFVGHTLRELDVRRNYRVNILGIQRPKKGQGGELGGQGDGVDALLGEDNSENSRLLMDLDPAEDKIELGDLLLVMGKEENISKLASR